VQQHQPDGQQAQRMPEVVLHTSVEHSEEIRRQPAAQCVRTERAEHDGEHRAERTQDEEGFGGGRHERRKHSSPLLLVVSHRPGACTALVQCCFDCTLFGRPLLCARRCVENALA
jgi:hypothetical protein